MKDNIFLEALIMIVLMTLWVSLALADEPTNLAFHRDGVSDSRSFDYVQYVEEVPEGGCRYVTNAPRDLDRLQYPEPPLLCNTLGIIRFPYAALNKK